MIVKLICFLAVLILLGQAFAVSDSSAVIRCLVVSLEGPRTVLDTEPLTFTMTLRNRCTHTLRAIFTAVHPHSLHIENLYDQPVWRFDAPDLLGQNLDTTTLLKSGEQRSLTIIWDQYPNQSGWDGRGFMIAGEYRVVGAINFLEGKRRQTIKSNELLVNIPS